MRIRIRVQRSLLQVYDVGCGLRPGLVQCANRVWFVFLFNTVSFVCMKQMKSLGLTEVR